MNIAMKKIVINKLETKRRNRSIRTILLVGMLAAGQALLLLTPYASSAPRAYEAYYNFLGNYPDEKETGWHEDVQGLTHDQDDWFITQTRRLWRIPVTHDLNKVSCGGGVVCRSFNDWPALLSDGYNHLGDPDYYEFGGKGFVLVPLEELKHLGGEAPFAPPAIAAFDADTLQYIAHAPLTGQIGAPWCAVDLQGNVYSSNFNDVAAINKFGVDWSSLSKSENPTLILSDPTLVPFFDENRSPTTIQSLQGGVISPSGELLYVVAGSESHLHPSHGIHVFDLSTGLRIQSSTNGHGYFNYEFHPGWSRYEEPEGITIWDLDDGRAPGIRGQLHVLMLDNDTTDDVYLKHYTHTIYVDRDYRGEEKGTASKPFNTVAEANNLAWDGARIKIKAGSYPEWPAFAKRVEVIAHGGNATIGR